MVKEKVGFDFARGTVIEFERGIATGNILQRVDRYEQAKILGKKEKNMMSRKKMLLFLAMLIFSIYHY